MCDNKRWSFIRDEKKRKWLERRGYKPITDEVIWEWMGEFSSLHRFEDAKREFAYYKRYGRTIVLYSQNYFEVVSLPELKSRYRRNIRRFVVDRMWLVKAIITMIHNISCLWWRVRLGLIRKK